MKPTGTLAWFARVFGPWLAVALVFGLAVFGYAIIDAIPGILEVLFTLALPLAMLTGMAGLFAIAKAIAERRIRP